MPALPKLYKRTELGQIQEWQIFVDGEFFRTKEGIQNGKITESKPTRCEGKNLGKKNETSALDQAYLEAKAKWKKKLDKGYFEDSTKVDEETIFKPMLAHKYQDYKTKITFPVYCQPKLNGERCIVKADGMWTRNGKPIVSCPHIFEALKPLLDKQPFLIFDGELYNHKFKDNFNKIMSLVRKTKPSKKDLAEAAELVEYHIFDLPSYSKFFDRRIGLLGYLLNLKVSSEKIKPVHILKVNTTGQLNDYHFSCLKEGYEGSMIRANGIYENKRSKNLLKRKEFMDEDFRILDVCEGKGNRSGMAGYMVLKLSNGGSFHSNIKANQNKLRQILQDKKEIIGRVAVCKFFQYTPDKVPLFPFVIDIKAD